MSNADWTLAGMLYVPLVGALIGGLLGRRSPRLFAGCLLSLLWVLTSLLVLQRLNQVAEWWRFVELGGSFCGMPVELYAGWVVLWGVLPQLACGRLRIAWAVALMALFDLAAMPMCGGVLLLGPRWLLGEAVAVVVVLLPATCVARWTMEDSHLRARAALQLATSGMLFLIWLPEAVFACRPGRGWEALLRMPSEVRQIALQILCVLALPGVAAVMEFAERGRGTPIPYDPPKRLVTSGIYRYCSNPMQLSCGLVMLAWAGLLRNRWLVLAAVLSVIYSAGIAAWDESSDLERRFGQDWLAYRTSVKSWHVLWRPFYLSPDARLYIALTCGPCSELGVWLESRKPLGLQIVDAETLPTGSIRRMRYEPCDGSATVDGVRALGRALEHLNFAWAMCGAALRLPGVWHAVQIVMDASGLGPRQVGKVA